MKQFYVQSAKCNLQQRATKNNGTVYDVVFYITTSNGLQKQKKLSGFKTKTAAKKAHLDFIDKYCETGKVSKSRTPKEVSQVKINDVFNSYILSLQNQVKESTIYDRRNIYNSAIKPMFGESTLDKLTKQSLYEWQDTLWASVNPRTGDHYSYQRLATIRSHFSAFLTWIAERYEIPNQLRNIKKPRRRAAKTVMQFWSLDEFNKFIDVVDDNTMRTIFCTLFYTGRRKGEVLALAPADVSHTAILFNKTITTRTTDDTIYKVTSTKNEKSDTTPICKSLQTVLDAYSPQSPLFFGGEKPIHSNTLGRYFDKYIAMAGVKRIRIHDLRHSFVSRCIHLGGSIYTVASLIGDTTEQVLKTYGHLYEQDKLDIINKL